MSKFTTAGTERDLMSALEGFRDRARAAKDAYQTKRQDVLRNDRLSHEAKTGDIAKLDEAVSAELASIRGEQEAHVKAMREGREAALRGNQPQDANSVLLRRDAADRVRKLTDENDALAVMRDAVHSGDASLQHAIGYRARQEGWVDALDAYKAAQPDSFEVAGALAVVEGLDRDPGYNLSNQITYAAPVV